MIVEGGERSVETLRGNGEAVHYAAEAFKHAKPVGAFGAGVQLLQEAPMPGVQLAENGNGVMSAAGVVTVANGGDLSQFAHEFASALEQHRHFDRQLEAVPA